MTHSNLWIVLRSNETRDVTEFFKSYDVS
jgi:hypothetical protein